MWEATITHISNVDSSGAFEVNFNVSFDNVLKYENLVRRGSDKSVLVAEIKEVLKDFKRQVGEAAKFNVGDKISIQ